MADGFKKQTLILKNRIAYQNFLGQGQGQGQGQGIEVMQDVYSIDEKARFYRMAKRSATECAGILDVCQRLQLVNKERYTKGRELLISIVSMLVKMAQKQR